MSPVLELGKAGLWCDPAETKFVFALNQQRVGLLLGTWSNPVWGRNNQYWLGLYCILVHVFVSSKVSFAWLFLAVRVPSHFKRNGNFTSPDSDPKRRSERRVHQPTGSRLPGPPESHLLSATLRALFPREVGPSLSRRLSFGPDPPTIRHGSALCCGDSGLSIQMGRHSSTLSKKSNWQNPIPISPPTFATARVRTPHAFFVFRLARDCCQRSREVGMFTTDHPRQWEVLRGCLRAMQSASEELTAEKAAEQLLESLDDGEDLNT